MAAPKLRHYTATAHGTAGTVQVVVPVVPTGRALVVSKLTVVAGAGGTPTPVTFSLGVGAGGNTDPSFHIANDVSLAAGEVYTETALTLVGDSLFVVCNTASGVRVNVFGQEVDN